MELRSYQKEIVEFFRDVPSAFDASDMGCGKTVSAIGLDSVRREQTSQRKPKTLVVAPLTGVVDSWAKHFKLMRPDLNVRRINPKKRNSLFMLREGEVEPDVFVVHWEACRPKLLGEWLASPYIQRGDHKSYFIWTHVIADEAHSMKNRRAQRTKGMQKVRDPKVEYKLAITGSPIVNRPDEMQQILFWLYRNEYEWRSYWRFFENYVSYIDAMDEQGQPLGYKIVLGPKNSDRLRSKISPFYRRLYKLDVLPELPEKYYTEYEVELTKKERKPYDEMHEEMLAWIKSKEDEEEPVVAPVVIAQLTRLQQFATGTGYLDDMDKVQIGKPSTKLNATLDIIESTDQQIVVFSQFAQFIYLLQDELYQKGIEYAILTGQTPHKARSTLIKDFQDGHSQVFAATIKAGGTGIDLFSSSTVIFVDRDWSPAINQQAEDRLHRSGQENAVQVIDLIAKDTVDLGRHQKLIQKWEWIKEVLDD